MEAPQNQQRCFESYFRAQVHHNGSYELQDEYTRDTYAFVICTINGEEQRFWVQNQPDRHVAHAVIEVLNTRIENERKKGSKKEGKTKVIVKMYTNKSPDSHHTNCDELILFKNRHDLDVELEIIISGLSAVQRKFCLVNKLFPGLSSCADHYGLVAEDESTANKQGLRNMDGVGIKLRTFKERDWSLLASTLGIRLEVDNARRREDQAMADDLNDILHETDQIVMTGQPVTLIYTPAVVHRNRKLSEVDWYKCSAEPEPERVDTADPERYSGGTPDHPALTILKADVSDSGSYFCKIVTTYRTVTDFSRIARLLVINPDGSVDEVTDQLEQMPPIGDSAHEHL